MPVRSPQIIQLLIACGTLVIAMLAPDVAAAQSDKLDNFQMRQAIPTELKQVAPDLYFLYDDLSSNAAFLVTGAGVLVVESPQYAGLRNYNRIDVFIEALHHLFITGKPMFAYP